MTDPLPYDIRERTDMVGSGDLQERYPQLRHERHLTGREHPTVSCAKHTRFPNPPLDVSLQQAPAGGHRAALSTQQATKPEEKLEASSIRLPKVIRFYPP